MQRKNPFVIASFIALVGCLGSEEPSPEITQATPIPQYHTTLVSLAEQAVYAQRELAEIRNSLAPTRHSYVNTVPPELKRTVSFVKWAGKLSIMAHDLAKEAGYSFGLKGKQRDVIVAVEWTEETTLIDAFADLGIKSGVRADVVVSPGKARVEVIYD